MPPKTYQKPNLSKSQQPQQSSSIQKQISQQLFINPTHIMENSRVMERIRTLISLLAGFLSGILNVNQLTGPFIYLVLHILITLILMIIAKPTHQYFAKKSSIFEGIGSGIPTFICVWMIVYNVIYTL